MMNYSHPLYFLTRGTVDYIQSILSKTEAPQRRVTVSGFVNELEAALQKLLPGQWPGESEVRALRFAAQI